MGQKPGHTIEERGLARSVRTDEADELPGMDGCVDLIDRRQPKKAFGEILNLRSG